MKASGQTDNPCRNEHGIALVTALLLTLLGLAIVMALLYMITWQSQLTAAHKRYKTAIDASHGAVEIVTKQVIPFIFNNNTTAGLAGTLPGINLVMGSSPCLVAKLNKSTSDWGSSCSAAARTYNLTDGSADMQFTLQGTQSAFNVYTKIVDTIPGNSDLSGYELLDSGAGVSGSSSGVSPKHMPAMYRIEVQSQKQVNPQEKALLSVLYAY